MRFSTIKGRFPTAHIEKAYGSAKDNRDYIRKEGRWADTEKAETAVPETFEEWGDLPSEKEESSPDKYRLLQSLREGMTPVSYTHLDVYKRQLLNPPAWLVLPRPGICR